MGSNAMHLGLAQAALEEALRHLQAIEVRPPMTTTPETMFVATLRANVDNGVLSDCDFRAFVRNSLAGLPPSVKPAS